jgi:hypothetical protein
MRFLLAIEAPAWADPAAGRTEQYRRGVLAKLIRDCAESVQIGAREGNIERDEQRLFATFRIETDEQTADAA